MGTEMLVWAPMGACRDSCQLQPEASPPCEILRELKGERISEKEGKNGASVWSANLGITSFFG